MTAKALRNPALRTKFKVGDTYTFPRDVWTRLTRKMVNLASVSGEVIAVGDQVIQHGKNKLCRFTVTFKTNHEMLFGDLVVWEEWMLEKLVLMYSKATFKYSAETGFRVNNHMVCFAFRYALGRRTAAVSIVVDHLVQFWSRLSLFDQKQIKTEIKTEIARTLESGNAMPPCDIEQWQKVLSLA